jgi:hypothetical protein
MWLNGFWTMILAVVVLGGVTGTFFYLLSRNLPRK